MPRKRLKLITVLKNAGAQLALTHEMVMKLGNAPWVKCRKFNTDNARHGLRQGDANRIATPQQIAWQGCKHRFNRNVNHAKAAHGWQSTVTVQHVKLVRAGKRLSGT